MTEPKRCYVFDLDGTLADLTHRLWYIQKPDKDWRGFFAACGDDALIEPVAELLIDLTNADHLVVILSGRSDECRKDTNAWLRRHELPHDALYMRREGDHRPDDVVKAEMLDALLADGYRPVMFFDDRDRVVEMWRSKGYVCLQCAPGGF